MGPELLPSTVQLFRFHPLPLLQFVQCDGKGVDRIIDECCRRVKGHVATVTDVEGPTPPVGLLTQLRNNVVYNPLYLDLVNVDHPECSDVGPSVLEVLQVDGVGVK